MSEPAEAPALDERDMEPRTPMKRLGSTRKLAAFNNIRLQLAEQSRVLEARAEATCGVAGELHDYCRRRADLEHEYSRALDKLARAAHQRHKDQKHKREQWPLTGAYACWQAALESARSLARDHAALAELYGGPLAARLQRAADDALRLHRKCRDVVLERHEELGAALLAAAAAGKDHAAAAADCRAAALKLRLAREARQDPPRHKKVKALDKELEKRRARHGAARAKALRARIECVLSLEAANATLQRYYLDDIADVILCMEVGFEAVVGRVVRCAAAAEAARGAAAGGAAAALRGAADALDALADRQRLLDAHAGTFALPRALPAAPAPPEPAEPAPAEEQELAAELAARLLQLEAAARALRAECQENAKTLDAAEAELVRQMEGEDQHWDVGPLFGAGALGGAGAGQLAPPPPPLDDQEDYYLAKFRAYVSCAGRLARVDGKAGALRGELGGERGAAPAAPRRAPRPLRAPGSRFAAAGAGLPRVLTECVRVIARYGLRQQGLFRVSGSQLEIAALRAAFERGEEPLARVADAADLHSVCGLLKLFLREARPPLLPPQLQARLLRVAREPEPAAFCERLRGTLAALPLPSVLVLRYLFAFLAHVAAHAAHTCMDAWNLAICVGPTLLAAWGEPPQQLAAQNLLNELVKRTILLHERVFPQDIAPHTLYRPPPEPEDEPAEPAEPAEPLPDDTDESSDELDSGEWPAAACRRASSECAAQERAQSPAPSPEPPEPEPAPPGPSDEAVSAGQGRRLAESTPDLVLDLPAAAEVAGAPAPPAAPPAAAPAEERAPSPASPAAPAPADAADTFAHNRDTLKKRPPKSPPGSGGGAGGAGGSPVPGRNTARVCAKFAELTLTGGSLKPALAAKPALLRRPAPPAQPPEPSEPR